MKKLERREVKELFGGLYAPEDIGGILLCGQKKIMKCTCYTNGGKTYYCCEGNEEECVRKNGCPRVPDNYGDWFCTPNTGIPTS